MLVRAVRFLRLEGKEQKNLVDSVEFEQIDLCHLAVGTVFVRVNGMAPFNSQAGAG